MPGGILLPEYATGRGAVLSEDAQYRYLLWREWTSAILPGRICCFFMLNPSTADALVDDQTIKKCIKFAQRWGFTRLEVVNLFAWRATDPEALYACPSPRSEQDAPKRNFQFWQDAFNRAEWIVAAWGKHATDFQDTHGMLDSLKENWPAKLRVLGFNEDGSPKHPLYLPGNTEPVMVVQ